jgi:probable rRNA maturation factor
MRQAALARWLERAAPARTRGAVNVAVVSDSRMRALNRRFRRRDHATDVLSFPVVDSDNGLRHFTRATHSRFLGDIVIARGVAAHQARAAGHSTSIEFRLLALHGLLHLIGYDHERDNGQMARVEARLRARAGLSDSLIARATRVTSRGRAKRVSLGRGALGAGVLPLAKGLVLETREPSTRRSASGAGVGPPAKGLVLETREPSTRRSASGAGVGPRASKK